MKPRTAASGSRFVALDLDVLPSGGFPDLFAIDLFAGAGGLSQGFRDAGFGVVQAVERDARASATYQTNHPCVDLLRADIRDLNPTGCLRRIGLTEGDVCMVIGGPPCQGFSESNRRTRNLDNPRNHLYREFVAFVKAIRPEWVVLENVAGLRTMAKGVILDHIICGLEAIGYRAGWRVLNAAHHGVPQVRRRLFVIANRVNLPIMTGTEFDDSSNGEPITVREAISDLPSLPNGASSDILEYKTEAQSSFQQRMRPNTSKHVSGNLVTRNAPHVVQRYPHIPEGGNWQHIPKHLLANYTDSTRCHTGIYHRLSWDQPSKVIGNFRKNMLIHPSQDRGLSIREAARLQGFRDDYRFRGSIGFQQQQVADAVPPILAKVVARAILKTILSSLAPTQGPRYEKDQSAMKLSPVTRAGARTSRSPVKII